MGIDKKTKPNYISVSIENKPEYIKELKKQGQHDGLENHLVVSLETHAFEMEEMYFDSDENELTISGSAVSTNGETYIHVSIPISDIVLIDILTHGVKKLSKLKGALETLK